MIKIRSIASIILSSKKHLNGWNDIESWDFINDIEST
jgi:hypothetical protein